ncbi:hypothetical protein [Streptomyces sp. GESEQ-35]|uniref:hypothetical protein n=1 Tax=Streptomyces sp. GESEQ-35 TaxID=2812657 RepID=UPI001B3319C9|nr:hypothetical protein [Streptomyces sp. GESEQ-35]
MKRTLASAASGCWGNAGSKQGPGGATYTAQQFTDRENPPVGDARNNWWLWTQADDAYSNNGWGWFPATKVSGGGNYQPIPGLQNC